MDSLSPRARWNGFCSFCIILSPSYRNFLRHVVSPICCFGARTALDLVTVRIANDFVTIIKHFWARFQRIESMSKFRVRNACFGHDIVLVPVISTDILSRSSQRFTDGYQDRLAFFTQNIEWWRSVDVLRPRSGSAPASARSRSGVPPRADRAHINTSDRDS